MVLLQGVYLLFSSKQPPWLPPSSLRFCSFSASVSLLVWWSSHALAHAGAIRIEDWRIRPKVVSHDRIGLRSLCLFALHYNIFVKSLLPCKCKWMEVFPQPCNSIKLNKKIKELEVPGSNLGTLIFWKESFAPKFSGLNTSAMCLYHAEKFTEDEPPSSESPPSKSLFVMGDWRQIERLCQHTWMKAYLILKYVPFSITSNS